MNYKNQCLDKLICAFLVFCFLFLTAFDANSIQLNDSLVEFGDVATYQITPDSSHVVYRADQDSDEIFELYSVSIKGGVPIKLNPELIQDGDVSFDFQISQDSSRVVYRADQDADEVYEIYSVAISGGPAVKLNSNLVPGGNVKSFGYKISPDNQQVIYQADQDQNDVNELYRVPLTGGPTVKLSGNLIANGNVSTFDISSDSRQVIYLADQNIDNIPELYSVEINQNTTPIKLNTDINTGFGVVNYQISDDNTLVIYRADQNINDQFDLFSVPISGGNPIQLNGNLVTGGDVFFYTTFFRASTNSNHVIYRADQNNDEIHELYSVSASGNNLVALTPNLPSYSDVTFRFEVTANGDKVVYRVDKDIDNIFELYSTPVEGGNPTQLNLDPIQGGHVSYDFKISRNGFRVIYRADQNIKDTIELFSTSINGGTPIKLNPDLITGGDVANFKISEDSARVIYHADQEQDDVLEIFDVDILDNASNSIKINTILPETANIASYSISNNNNYVVYYAAQDIVDQLELFAHQLENLNNEIITSGELCFPVKSQISKISVVCF